MPLVEFDTVPEAKTAIELIEQWIDATEALLHVYYDGRLTEQKPAEPVSG
jgi:hypothetical protein